MSPEPCQRTHSTSAGWNSPERIAGRKRFRPGLVLISDFSFAYRKTSFRGVAPARASTIGRANSSKVTIVDTGFPGRPKKYLWSLEATVGTRPNTTGLPG